ncbi:MULTISPECIES: 3-oxoacyl-ACP synthase III family protein [unclassified Tenacibaculum]|uniref:3-oxoacyl-ACP synthase III family protein n=1 Tax=unclassified Tenacibaculum TaxID=2635139 RepID=UPI001F368C2B|nr:MULTISPECIES: 3-oxoacyl-ACP synthase III family protein [unclassified Tenacibaculum]MCF2876595.1 3-oxoacyl-ACP synthase III family protein [Tenacibaculum sp. Cn5-1]MCF2936746.1 3-oxoacyl-ACP synthase III family protein [Tenacibaculum sp. Cn5-34]MCG7512970.1 3-oxoacyl-ACP synthase III family protein [Tenacibaculum sp. Cn5-46]
MTTSVITGTGTYITSIQKTNAEFSNHQFLNEDGSDFPSTNDVIIEKFKSITGIEERRYAKDEYNASDLGYFAAQKAIKDANIDPEELDYIILAHNFGDVKSNAIQSDILPSLATRVKYKLGIENPNCVAYDILFGCPGWVEGVIQAQAFIKAGIAKKCLVIGAETLSRVVDQNDRDSMIYSDGAGACIVEAKEGSESGIISHASQTFTKEEAFYLFFGKSYNKSHDKDVRYIKMHGRKIYEFALNNVPNAMKIALDKSRIAIDEVKKVFIHQANEKMDEAIIKRFFRLYKKPIPEGIMPMSIHKLGNSSVATVPTLLDLVLKGKIEDQKVEKGDVIMLASVGSGMSINAIVYRY